MMMRATILFTSLFAVTSFMPAPLVSVAPASRLFSDPEEEEAGLDLDLGEMFDMFDAAEKDEDFDEALKKVKGE